MEQTNTPPLDINACERARLTRDPSYDGVIFIAVTSTRSIADQSAGSVHRCRRTCATIPAPQPARRQGIALACAAVPRPRLTRLPGTGSGRRSTGRCGSSSRAHSTKPPWASSPIGWGLGQAPVAFVPGSLGLDAFAGRADGSRSASQTADRRDRAADDGGRCTIRVHEPAQLQCRVRSHLPLPADGA